MTFVLRGMAGMGIETRPVMMNLRGRPFISTSTSTSTFASQSSRRLKETDRDHPDLGTKYENHKQEQLKKQKEGKGEWTAELASSSEEAVVADRHEHWDHSERGLRELQEKTAGHAEEKMKK